ncbi:pentapeptide repeat-containing protein [Nonomuraea polychroma]|uniref:pentapeptide repeat-containing protein n=1 Tax=Nonomuraea polychroma TaxID=46176 RepID=UPI003D918DF1
MQRILIWVIGILIVTVITTAVFQLLGRVSTPSWWMPVLKWLPDYLIPEYTVSDLPLVLLTVLGLILVLFALVRIVRKIARKGRLQVRELTQEEADELTPKDRFDALNAARATRLQRISTFGIVFGLLFTAGSLVYTARSLETTQEGQLTDRYTKAIEQLGSKTLDVRLGAIYALERLAHDSPRDRRSIVEVLGAYVREHDPSPKSYPPDRPKTDIQATLTVLARITVPDGNLSDAAIEHWLENYDERMKVNLEEARVPGARLSDAFFWDANMRRIDLGEADLHDAALVAADLTGADLAKADISYAELDGADLVDADLKHANLSGASLEQADLTGADLSGANLSNANLYRAVLHGADLRGADLRDARGLPAAKDLSAQAKIDARTRF